MKSFFSKLKAEFLKLFKSAPHWTAVASQAMTLVIAPAIEDLLAVIDPALGTVIDPIINTIKLKLASASVLINDAASTTSLTGLLTDIKNDFAQMLALADVKSSATAAKFTEVANVVGVEIDDIIGDLPAITAK